jgi:citrate lyase subunit beta/citryl-CoA lyase
MGDEIAEAGNRGDRVRSDCWIQLKPVPNGGVQIKLKSKVDVLYGESIKKLVNDMMVFFGINHVEIEIEDSGALPFVIMARLDCPVTSPNSLSTRPHISRMD